MEQLNIVLNGKNIKGKKGQSILELARENGYQIPTLCHDPRLKPYSSCYVCVVQVEGMKGLQPSCSTYLNEGMVIDTENQAVRKARKTALDLLLSNHYADCVGPCKETCPAGVDVQGYISLIEKKRYSEAIALIKETNPLPAICGRVCVRPCEVACRRNLLDEKNAVGIDYLKRFAADEDLMSSSHYKPEVAPSTGKNVAIIGAGPGGLSAAYFLQQKGHQCDIYEAAPKSGGWLRYGIPEYRLPNDILDKEVETITELGTNIYYNKKLGGNLSYKELKEKYDATILTIGSQKGTMVGCEGDDAENVYSGIDFLKNMEMTGKRPDFKGKKVVVVGGGNTAMDCCRTSIRLGSTDVKVVYRRTEKEMPANPIEIHESKLEGVEYLFLNNPVKIHKDEKGKLKSMTLIKMELGEPDASGRRRPVPIEGSEYEIEVDYVLAAIGQKTVAEFVETMNTDAGNGELKLNRWGDIDADSKTLQTGIPNVFAAGDGVTGPATIIEAIAQAKIASNSCHQYLSGKEIKPLKKEFLSKRDNFKTQVAEDYVGNYKNYERQEMPVLDPKQRLNFNEVELGYDSEETAQEEAKRCLECGCTELYTCDLKKHATEYGAEQNAYEGEFKEYKVDFSHPYIEIDNNKCVLCSRCVRICSEVVGANALGLVNRGFETFVAPSLGSSLTETNCESCGLCIEACPTGALTENVPFKPGPLKLESIHTIDPFGSEGEELELRHTKGFYMQAGTDSGLISRQAKFGYRQLNNKRIQKPLLKKNGKFEEISYDEAFRLIADKIKAAKPQENMFMAGGRLSNEELYSIQKLARAGAKTNNVNSFLYLERGMGYHRNAERNVPFGQLAEAKKVYVIGAELTEDHQVAGQKIVKAASEGGFPISLITDKKNSSVAHKADELLKVKSYYHFVKAANFILLHQGLENAMFIKDNCAGFDSYKQSLLKEDYAGLCKEAGLSEQAVKDWTVDYNLGQNQVIVFSEKYISSACSEELYNLAMITGKLGKTASGLIALKEKNNAQGTFDMGIRPLLGVGQADIADEAYLDKLEKAWKVSGLPRQWKCQCDEIKEGKHKNMFIFGEDPVGCAKDKKEMETRLGKVGFLVVQDYYETPTTALAELVLPASLPWETGGTYTNAQKNIKSFAKAQEATCGMSSPQMYSAMMKELGVVSPADPEAIMSEIASLLPAEEKNGELEFRFTVKDNYMRPFDYGCDSLQRMVEEGLGK